MRKRFDWTAVQRYYDDGHGRDACIARFGFCLDAWYKAIARGHLTATVDRTHYDWAAVQRHHDAGHSMRACRREFGFATASWAGAVKRGDLRPRPQRRPLAVLLLTGRCRGAIKRRLIGAGILKNVCDECGLDQWRGKPLSIQIDHRNGIRNDHRLENLRMLCPNCHSQTDTFAGRNTARHNPG